MCQTDTPEYKYLGHINSPQELKALRDEEITPLCAELRQFLVERVSENGGHLASNLGAVELSVAIHRVFDCPHDHVIFDVGHQSYIHKILTGRFDRFDTLRRGGGVSGFTKRSESEYDCFGAGHSSTSLSAGLGFAKADRLSGSDAYTVVVLGDGAFTGGMIHEALNNCERGLKLIIILNENEMSISKNIGSFARSMAKLRKKKGYFKTKRFTANALAKIPLVGKYIVRGLKKIKKALKNALYGSNYFEDLGLYYLGPADGNCYEDVEELMREAKRAGESVLIHLKTQKGKGYADAEQNPGDYHGLRPRSSEQYDSSFSQEFGKMLAELASEDKRICAITAAMGHGTGLDDFESAYPDRFFDVGIAEEHAVTFAAGLSASGYKPVCAIYSTFLQRAYDQIIHDVALQGLPMLFGIDRAGLNAADGATHHGIFDVAFLSEIPGVRIYTPVTYEGMRRSVKRALSDGSISAVRYPSGAEKSIIKDEFYSDGSTKIGVRANYEGKRDAIIITHGRIAAECIKAQRALIERGVSCGILLCEYISPYGELACEIHTHLEDAQPRAVVFVEEEIRAGGFGMILSDKLRHIGALDGKAVSIIAVDNSFVIQSKDENIYTSAGVDAESITSTVLGSL